MWQQFHNLLHPCYSPVLTYGKPQLCSLLDGMGNVQHKVGMRRHTLPLHVVHPRGTQCHRLRADAKHAPLCLQFMPAVHVLRSNGNVLGQQTALPVPVIHLVAGEEHQFRPTPCRSQCHVARPLHIHAVTLLGMLFAIPRVRYRCQMHHHIGEFLHAIPLHRNHVRDVHFPMPGGKDGVLALPPLHKAASHETARTCNQNPFHDSAKIG